MIGIHDREELHRYTRNRFACNEAHEMARRYVPFNLEALADVAAHAIGSAHCVSVEKLPDGNYNKTFLLTMNDGAQVVAKLPNPNAGRSHLTVASEVATMDFVRVRDSKDTSILTCSGARKARDACPAGSCMVFTRRSHASARRIHHHGESQRRYWRPCCRRWTSRSAGRLPAASQIIT